MTKQLRSWILADDIYQAQVCLYHGNYDEFVKLIKRELNLDSHETEPLGLTSVIEWQGKGYKPARYLIWLPTKNKGRSLADINTVSHEALHATFYVLLDRGLKPKADNHEAFTYYHGWLLEQVLKRIRPQ